MFDNLSLIYPLKTIKRKGWVLRKIPNVESVADHSYMLGLLALTAKSYYKNSQINFDHCVQIALIHDLAEAQVGDITPHDGVSEEEKFNLEKKAFSKLPQDLQNLWLEYEKQETIESHFVKDCDKFDMIYQAYLYENEHNVNLQEFFDSASFKTSIVKEWVSKLNATRNKIV
eukprot:NODE_13_length_54415_cov_0.522424.p34 type:complete len:172 gc:universal NODE_13_length_54415_cov_0.522424:18347-18862(+)